ncbi:serine/threonine-protein kinase [Thermomonospora curvata]|uniref:non-specific serine/threonine protein kinase n=1 Tax=Thermomonospora curvata (strain ATCC 19995 / DSM 43183 / JCM 3096 / KCTC 9072 / NBRC 15933 / NCIMB 10081 / Henssen B9) TaxID=471852 RepID=D1A989_THECD|nr:serine/threonine-protein kinase [Thermomonospora curvata]ACY96785.1 serine/threonine protein kinase [Thermomonospora curvata DSM 43183]
MTNAWRLAEFEEIRELGTGAQGRVVLARHRRAGTPVAIKYLECGEGDREAIERLRQEAMLLGKVSDPHVVRLYSFVVGEQGAALVMEAINGVSLKEILARHGALSPEAALTVLKGSLLGLAAAHAVGVVHRDYKPANVVVRADGLSKLIDFGVATLAGAGSRSGTPAYMAPEQWAGHPATPATDVYAATCVFFECITGSKPFSADNAAALMHRHLTAPVPVEAVPEPLRPLLARGMAKDAAHRPPGAAAFVTELEEAASAAYGADWEQRGIRALAAGAAALAALFPLAAGLIPTAAGAGTAGAGAGAAGVAGAGSAGTAGAGMSGAAAGAAGAGSAGGAGAAAAAGASAAGGAAAGGSAIAATAGTGLLATAGAKVTAAVAGTVLAIGAGTTAVVVAGGDDGPAVPAAQNVAVRTPTLPERVIELGGGQRLIVEGAQYVQISGHSDSAVQQRVNAALRSPLDTAIEGAQRFVRENPEMGRPGPGGDCQGASLSAKAVPGLRNGRLVSVRYELKGGWVCNTDYITDWVSTVTVALDTGKALALSDMFAPATLTQAGLDGLWRRFPKPTPTPDGLLEPCRPPARLRPADLRPVSGGFATPVVVGFTDAAMTLSVSTDEGAAGCIPVTLSVPHDRVRDLLRPEFAAMLAGRAPTPSRS